MALAQRLLGPERGPSARRVPFAIGRMVAGVAQDFREEMHEHGTKRGQTGAHDRDLGLQDRPMNDGL